MDAAVQIALMEKLKAVLAEPGTFISFPTVPLSFTSDGLASIIDGAQTPGELQIQTSWLGAVNQVPTGEMLMSLSDRYLWKAFADVVHGPVKLAQGTFSAEDQAVLAAAEATLYRADPATGQRAPSDKLKAYDQHRDVWFGWNQTLRKREIEVADSADPEERKYWDEVERPTYLGKIREAEDLWRVAGFRQEIDAAYGTVKAFAARGPSQSWTQWGSRLSLDIDTQSDINSIKSVPTGFSPVDFMHAGTWPSFTLGNAEVGALLARAPTDMLQRFAVTGVSPDIVSVSFEYTSVTILRDWFAPEVFQARFWRFGDAGRMLSDGGTPPRGELPGYIAAVVFLRNLVVERRAGSQPEPVRPGLVLSPFIGLRRDSIPVSPGPMPPRPLPDQAVRVRDHRVGTALRAAGGVMTARIARVQPAAAMRIAGATAVERGARVAAVGAEPRVMALKAQTFNRLDAKYADIASVERELAVRRPGIRPLPFPRPQQPAPPEIVRQTGFTGGDMGVLAFVCRSLPRCPDPDPALVWT
ncbi:hypothetical protein JL101_016955 [Skermanella rosea]|uniref:hypothetical protein n=1 Tax=Skermanella rosea TaxID=1817965 RepID=UPI001932ED1B|nr:hypothetical protein [Skermanella rosea]UEM01688.1 hypothetical protein JL101_016955 [Skermanella rosea]